MKFTNNQSLGRAGENFATALVRKNGHELLERNWRVKAGEIDIITLDGNTVVFTEVKTRQNDKFGAPQLAVTATKQKHMSLTALHYMQEKDWLDKYFIRFDVIALIWNGQDYEIEWIKNAFEFNAGKSTDSY